MLFLQKYGFKSFELLILNHRMHRYKLHILFMLLILNCFAQDQDIDIMSRHRPGFMWYYTGIKPAIPEKVRKYDRLIFDITYNDWISKSQKPFKVSPLSIGFNTNLMFDIPLTKGNTQSFGIGIAYGLYRVQMKDFFVRNDKDESTTLISDISQYGIDKSVFKYNSLSIPMEFRFRGKNWKHAKFHIGGKVSYLFHPNTNLSSKISGITSLQKTIGFHDFNHLNASAHMRFGIRNWSFYASYNFLKLFKNKSSVQLNPFQIGLSISLF